MNEMENGNSDNSENVLRERFSEAPTLDTNLWENIEKALIESDKRRRFILFRNVTIVLLVIGFSFSYLFNKLSNDRKFANIKENDNENLSKLNQSKNSNKNRTKKTKIKYHQSNKSENESRNQIALKTQIEVPKIAYTENLSSTHGSRNQNQITAATNLNIEKNSNLDALTKQETTNEKIKSETKSNNIENAGTEVSVNESKLTNNAIIPNSNLVNSKIEKVETSEKLASNIEAISTPTTIEASVQNNNFIKSEMQNTETEKNLALNNETISTSTTIEKDTTIQKDSIIENIANTTLKNDNQPKGIIAQPFKRWEIGVAITPAFSFRNLTTNNSLPTLINSSERGTIKTNFGFSFGYHLNDNFKISGGVATLNYNSEFDVVDLVVYCDTDENTIEFETDFGTITENQEDFEGEEPDENELNENEEEYITVNVKGSQTIQMIQLPIIAALKTNGKKVNFFIEGGLTLNSITKSEFDVKIEGYEGITRTNPFNLNQITSSLVINGGIEYKFSNSFSIQISPTFRYSINSISSSSSSKIHPYWLGTNIALAYRF